MGDRPSGRQTALLTAFATAGVVTTAQELATAVLLDIQGADASLVAEETLCLVALTSARAIQAASDPLAEDAVSAMQDLPFLYRDYILGGALIEDPDRDGNSDQSIYQRLDRVRSFYTAHFPPGDFPGPRAIEEKMALWMGRVSPPRLHELPVDRLTRLKLAPRLNTHLRLVLEFTRQAVRAD
jgi:hypothetical protein